MSLAAKSGQMQIFNNMNVNHSLQPKPLAGEQIDMSNKNYNHMSSAQKQGSLPPTHPKNLMPIPQVSLLNAHANVLNLNNQQQQVSNQSTPLARQFGQYGSRRQIIEQQREKKQELLK